jgi:hypothetical protein
MEDLYSGGEENAINNINKWKETIRKDLKNNGICTAN